LERRLDRAATPSSLGLGRRVSRVFRLGRSGARRHRPDARRTRANLHALAGFADNQFTESYISTIGVDFRFKTVQVDGKTIKLQIWDTAGQERFRTITSAYYRGADGVVMVYDITHRESFDHVSEWLAEVNKHASEDCCKLILGNKSDAPGRAVTTEEARAKSEELACPFLETSAKSNTNVEEAFLTLASELLRRAPTDPPKKKRLSLVEKAKGRKCCA